MPRLLAAITLTAALILIPTAAAPAAVQIDFGSGALSRYAEDAPPAALFPQLTLPGAQTPTRAVVKLTNGNAFDRLDVEGGRWDPLYRTLELRGGAVTREQWEAWLRKVSFSSSNQDPAVPDPQREVELLVEEAANTAARTLKFDIQGFNDAPVVELDDPDLAYRENQDDPVLVDGDTSITDVDNTTMSGASVSLQAGNTGDTLVLGGSPPDGVQAAYDPSTKVLTITGTATLAQYESLLSTVKYHNPSDAPSGTERIIRVTAIDGGDDQGRKGKGWDERTLTMAVVDDAPVIGGVASTATARENTEPALTPELVLTDPDSSIRSATIVLGDGRVKGEDYLEYVPGASSPISSAFDPEAGIMTLATQSGGGASAGDFQNALRRVRYVNYRRESPTPHTLTASIGVTDVTGMNSEPRRTALSVEAVEDPVQFSMPVLVPIWQEGSAPVNVAASMQVSDPDTTTFRGAQVRIISGMQDGDVLAGPASTPGSWNPATGTLTFVTGNSTISAYQNLLRQVTFRSGANPVGGERLIEFSAGEGANRGTGKSRMKVEAVNDKPIVGLADAPLGYTERGPAVPVDKALSLGDTDSPELQSATVELVGEARQGDLLRFTGALPAGVTSTYDAAARRLTFMGRASVDAYRALLRTVEFLCENPQPVTAARTVRVTAVDNGSPASSGSDSRRIEILSLNDPPVVAIPDPALAVTEGADASTATPGVTITDPDDTLLRSASMAIDGFQKGEEELIAGPIPSGLAASYDADAGRLTLAGSAPIAAYQTALRAVSYRFMGDAPSSAPKALVVSAFDGQSEAVGRRGLTVAGSNDAPRIRTTAEALQVAIAGAPVAVDPTLDLGDPDSAEIAGARVEIDPGTGVLGLSGTFGGISAAYDSGTGRLALSGTAPRETYEAALRAVTYQTNMPGDRDVRFVASDGQLESAVAARAISAAARPGQGTPGPVGITIVVGGPGSALPIDRTGAEVNCAFDRGVLSACQIRLIGVDGTVLGTGARAGEGRVRVVLNRAGRARLAVRPLGMPVLMDGEGLVEDGTVFKTEKRTFLLPDASAPVSGLFPGRSRRLSARGRSKLAAIAADAAPLERVRCVVKAPTKALARARARTVCAALKRTKARRTIVARAGRKSSVRLVPVP